MVVRLGDKYHRVKNFVEQGELKVKDESVLDTLVDLINYGCLAHIMYEDSLPKKTLFGCSRLGNLPCAEEDYCNGETCIHDR